MNFKKIILLLFLVSTIQVYSQDDFVKVGGALRYNLFMKSWDKQKTDPQLAWDTWRLNVDARAAGIDMSFEYRFYPSGNYHMLHHGWFGYGFNDDLYMKLGVSQVPFGITKFASHSWFFQIPYYIGLEDDYDMGIKFDYTGIENLTLNAAYYHQAEPQGAPGFNSRYSYDITPSLGKSVTELGQFNLRAAYNITDDIELGLSGQYGRNYNTVLETSEASTAFAAHLVGDFGNFNFKGEYINYNYAANNDLGIMMDKVQMSAYAADYNVAAKGNIYVAGLAYSIPVSWGPISNLQPYVDYSIIDKSKAGFESTQHLVPGLLITAGSIYTYIDYALGTNNPWIGGDWSNGLAEGLPNAKWESRFNINMGFYF